MNADDNPQHFVDTDTNVLLRLVHEMGTIVSCLCQERAILEATLTLMTRSFVMETGAVFLYDGQAVSLVAETKAHDDAGFSSEAIAPLVYRYLRDGADAIRVLTDIEYPAGSDGSTKVPVTGVLAPLITHGAPMGVIVLLTRASSPLTQDAKSMIHLCGQLLAGRLREMHLNAQLDTAMRKLSAQSERIDPNATIDPLHGVTMQRQFQEMIQQHVTETLHTGGHFSLLILRVDYFREMTRDAEAARSDEVLSRVAHEIQANIRTRDITTRYHGAEFWVLLPATPGLGAVVAAERLRERIAALTFFTGHTSWRLTVSIGVACLSSRITSADQLITNAATCLERAQELQGNQVLFDWEVTPPMMAHW